MTDDMPTYAFSGSMAVLRTSHSGRFTVDLPKEERFGFPNQ